MAISDGQLEILGAEIAELYQQLERDTIADIARRLLKTQRFTETAERQVLSLRRLGYSPDRIYKEVLSLLRSDADYVRVVEKNTLSAKKQLRKRVDALTAQIPRKARESLQDVGDMAFLDDLRAWKQGAMPVKDSAFALLCREMGKRAGEELRNLTKSMGFRMPNGQLTDASRAYAAAMDTALVRMTSGAFTYRQAVERAVMDLSRSGLRSVDFASGRSMQLDTAASVAVRTAASQLAGQITMHNVETTGVDYVEVSCHTGARTGEGHANHAGWQGKVYRVQGSDAEYENLEEATGYPSDPAGLCGYNCRHSFYPFWPGISERAEMPKERPPIEVDGVEYTEYQASQKQRSMERKIRALKRELHACEDIGDVEKAKQLTGKIRDLTAEYNDFSSAVGLRPKTERLYVAEFASTVLTGRKSIGTINLPDTISLADMRIFPSVGAKRLFSTVHDLSAGDTYELAPNTSITHIRVFAGKGVLTPYYNAWKYADRFGGNESDWQHVKGNGILLTDDGERPAEIHWSRCEGIGDFDPFVKRWLDES